MAERKSVDFWKEQFGKWKSTGLNQSGYCRFELLTLPKF